MRLSQYRLDQIRAWALILSGLLVLALVCWYVGVAAADATWEATRVNIRY